MFRLNVRQYVWHVGYYFEFNISLISFSTVSKNRVCIPLKTTQPETDIAHIRYYYGIVRKSVEKKNLHEFNMRTKFAFDMICLVCLRFVWLAQRYNHVAYGSNFSKSFSRYRRFFMRWTLFWDCRQTFSHHIRCHVHFAAYAIYFCDMSGKLAFPFDSLSVYMVICADRPSTNCKSFYGTTLILSNLLMF